MKKMVFALCFGNRGFMPGELILGAREEMVQAVKQAGYDCILMDENATRFGAVETRDEGLLYAKWLKEHEGQYDGVIFCMPIFVDENGAANALLDAGVPILMQAYPDEIGKMDFKYRRDAYCGKFSVTDVFCQLQNPLYRDETPCGAPFKRCLCAKPAGFCRHLPGGERHETLQPGLHRCSYHRV
ncbi:MAG: hypothetical protein ACOX6Y_09690 [Christensenellales bacterium]